MGGQLGGAGPLFSRPQWGKNCWAAVQAARPRVTEAVHAELLDGQEAATNHALQLGLDPGYDCNKPDCDG